MGRFRSSAAATAAVVLLAVTATACGGGDDDVRTTASSSSSTSIVDASTTVPTTPGEPTTTVDATPATTVAGPAPTSPPATAPPATAPPGPVALSPAAPGLYRYTTSGASTLNGAVIPFPPVTTNLVDAAVGNRQHATRDLRSGGNGPVTEYTFEYRPDGVYLVALRLTTTYGGQSDVRDLTPPAPLLFLATGAAPGASSVLDIPVPTGGTARVVVDVLGTEAVTIGGRAIDTLVVRSVATLPPGTVTGTQSLTVNLDRASRLWVKERGVADASATVSGFPVTVHSEYSATIQSLAPG